jgi:hypothetical protein
MILLLLRWMLLLISGLMTAIIGVRMMPYSDSPLAAFMTAPENCGGTCLLGVRAGTTRVSEAMIFLRQHSWVSEVSQNIPGTGYAQITWTWSGQQPQVIDASREGRITFYWDNEAGTPELVDAIIETITIYTHLRMYSLHQWLGEADSGSATIRPDGNLSYAITYAIRGGMMNLTGEMPCPVNPLTYWNARTRLTMSIGRSSSSYVPLNDMLNGC